MSARQGQSRPLSELLDGLAALDGLESLQVSGLTLDSREVQPGDLFLACRGGQAHGLDYAEQALQRGAAAIAWEPNGRRADTALGPAIPVENLSARAGEIAARFYGRPTAKLFVVGITGTDGKSSCAHLLAQALEQLGQRCGYLGTLGFGFLPGLEIPSHTTPDAVRLQAWLARLADEGAGSIAMEVSSHALDQQRTNAVEFDLAVLTNIGRDHLDYHGDVHDYAAAKRRLFDQPDLTAAILNRDDPYGRQWIGELAPRLPVVSYGIDASPDQAEQWLACAEPQLDADGIRLRISGSWGEGELHSPLLGRFNAYNLLAMLAVLLIKGVALDQALSALAAAQTVPGRMQAVARAPLVVVDYAHTPGALEQALAAMRGHCAGALYCVFGCGGERDAGKRPLMGAAAAEGADHLIITDDNPRGEDPGMIVEGIRSGLPMDCDYRIEHDRRAAIRHALERAGPEDAVLVAGKGHEDYQEIGGERRPFSDRAVIAELVAEAGR